MLPLEACQCGALVLVWFVLIKCEPSCDHAQFFHSNGTCVACPVCGPGEQLSEDCGFGDGGKGVCVVCGQGEFSLDTGVAPCRRCTKCGLLNRLQSRACMATSDALCGQCLPGHYELRSMTGEVELPCLPCYKHDTGHKECLTAQGSNAGSSVSLPRDNFKKPAENKLNGETFSMALVGSVTACSIFLVALVLWAFLLTAERFKQAHEFPPQAEELLSPADLQYTPLSDHPETAEPPEVDSKTPSPAAEPLRSINSLSHDNEVHPTSIVINVTTNINPSGQNKENSITEDAQSSCEGTEEMERKLQTIWEMAQGQSIEMLSYDSVQDLSLLLDSTDNRPMLKRLGQSLGVPPQVITHLHGFQDLFQYLRTSTYTLLPQLAQAAALLPHPEVVAKIHRAVVKRDHHGLKNVFS